MESQTQSVEKPTTSESAQRREQTVGEVIELEKKVRGVYEQVLAPLAERFTFRFNNAKSEPTGLPTVLLLGNHSSGKSSFINHIFGREIQKTGVAPVDDGFTLIMHGENETDLGGKAVVTHPKIPYQSLEQFGPTFLSHLKLKVRTSEVVRSLVLIDSPGMIDSAKVSRTRGYDFTSVVRHFAESADLIVFFFDPDKPGTTGESLSVFSEALTGVAHKLLIVMNKVDLFPNIRDFARAYGALCWNLAHVIKTKDMPHIFCTFIDTADGSRPTGHLPLDDFRLSRAEVIAEIDRTPERRSDNLVDGLYDTARRLHMYARVSAQVSARFFGQRLRSRAMAGLVLGAGGATSWFLYNLNQAFEWRQLLPAAVGLVVGVVYLWIQSWLAKRQLAAALTQLDAVFQSEYQHELAMQGNKADLEALWEVVKPRVIEYLQQTRIQDVPRKTFNRGLLHKVETAIERDIPNLRRDILKA